MISSSKEKSCSSSSAVSVLYIRNIASSYVSIPKILTICELDVSSISRESELKKVDIGIVKSVLEWFVRIRRRNSSSSNF